MTSSSRMPPRGTALIQVAKSRLGLDDDAYRALLSRAAGVTSSRELDGAGFDRVMDEFRRLGFTSDARAKGFGDRPGMATPAQIARLRRLRSEFTDGKGDDFSLGKWLLPRWGVEHLRFLSQADAHRAVGGLENMVRRRKLPSGRRTEMEGR